MRIVVALVLALLPSLFLANNRDLASTYISSFKEIAIEEMHRTGIPASIKLAQGLLESDWGRSDLAVAANNHFGIKCGVSWNGETFYKKDDDKDEKGRLIKSCFRAFDDPMESYMAHSDFLTDPKKAYRYGFLFEYGSTDYKAWAKGLRKSGYATDPKYPNKLIQIIEKYNLARFDEATTSYDHAFTPKRSKKEKKIVNASKRKIKKDTRRKIKQKRSDKKTYAGNTPKSGKLPAKYNSRLAYPIGSINNCRMVTAKGGETLHDLSKAVGVSIDEVLAINEIYDQSDKTLDSGDIVYLEKKKRSYRGDQEYHKVQEGETMESIAQLYGLRLKSLYAKNRMPKGSFTFPGVKLSIRKTVSLDERPKFKSNDTSRGHLYLFEDDQSVN